MVSSSADVTFTVVSLCTAVTMIWLALLYDNKKKATWISPEDKALHINSKYWYCFLMAPFNQMFLFVLFVCFCFVCLFLFCFLFFRLFIIFFLFIYFVVVVVVFLFLFFFFVFFVEKYEKQVLLPTLFFKVFYGKNNGTVTNRGKCVC